MRIFVACFLVLAVGLGGAMDRPSDQPAGDLSFGIPKRIPWTASHITGSPEPPLPYRAERIFPKLSFKNPLLLTRAPGTERLFVAEQAGKLYSFPNNQACAKAELFLDLTTEVHSWDASGKVKGVGNVYGLCFHPQFAKNRYCYICYVLDSKTGEPLADGSRLARFRVTDSDPPRCDPASEKLLLTWLAGGHNGGDLHFGPDGYLYISTGDAADPNPPDRLDTGQDLGDLLSSILRIDVDHEANGKAYAIPSDNPFLQTPGARPEIWAYGFRNPWRMSFDRATGDLWVGDVGWELWEMVDRVQRGGNYGWSVMEGRQPVRPESKRGPTPILPPTLDFPHTEAASISGGYVYRGKRLPELAGAYICGDWVTRKLWGTRFDGDKITWNKELATCDQRIVAFGEDHAGELYIVGYEDAGRIYRLVPNEAARQTRPPFPTRISETGLFASTPDLQPAPGVIAFSVNAEQWRDHATAQRLLALPGETVVRLYDNPVPVPGGFYNGQVFFPRDGVLARTFSLEMERGNPQSRRRLETQILHFDGTDWHGYSYAWNDEQTDATLVPAGGIDRSLTVVDAKAPKGKRQQNWHFPSRTECMTCHNPWAGQTLAFNLPQINRSHAYGPVTDNQVRALEHAGLITLLHQDGKKYSAQALAGTALVNPDDPAADLNSRARAYLHVNCSHCHQFGAGGTADLELRSTIPLEQTKTLGVRPAQGTFEIFAAQIVSPGDPYRSVLFYRMAKLGRGRMPHLGSEIVDERGLRLIHDWIRQLPIHREEAGLIDKLRALDDSPADKTDQRGLHAEVSASAQPGAATTPENRQQAAREQQARSAAYGKERTEIIQRLLSSTGGALMLVQAMDEQRFSASVRSQVVMAATARPEPQIRDLFERFVPDSQRVKRLGSVIKPALVLAAKGDAARGKELFFKAPGLQCSTCHRVGSVGSTLGPDLSQIGKKYSRAQILENILEPSKSIDPKYVVYLAETTDGQVHTGLLGDKNAQEVVLKMAADKEVHLPANKVQTLVPQKNSLMPEQLLRDLTLEQAADLLEFLATQR